MNFQDYQGYILPAAILGFFIWRSFKFRKVKSQLPHLLENGAVIIDVRSSAEFQRASRPGSINIPLSELSAKAKSLDKKKTIVLCCASGTRSGMAVGILKKNGFPHVLNIGSWTNTLA